MVEWWMGDGGGWTVVAKERHRTRGHLEAAKARHSGIDAAALGHVARVWATVAAAKGVALLERHALGEVTPLGRGPLLACQGHAQGLYFL